MKKPKRLNQNSIKNILIVNVHSSQNAGDYALLIQTIYYLKETFGNVSINILANWPNELSLEHICHKVIGSPWWLIKVWDKHKKPRYQVLSFMLGNLFLLLFRIDIFSISKRVIPETWFTLFKEYKDTDLVVAVSGNQLFSSGRLGWPLPVICMPIYLGLFFHKKILIFPQSVGPFNTRFEKIIVKFLYNHVSKLYIRDLESLKLIHTLKIKKSQPEYMHDPAFTFPPTSESKARRILKRVGFNGARNNIGFTIISTMPSYLSPETIRDYYFSIGKTIENLTSQSNFEVFLFCQVYGPTKDENDFIGIKRVLKEINKPLNNKIHIVKEKLHPSELKACYGLMDLFIASRLHSGIFSLGMRVPTLFIGYLYKTAGILNAINLGEYQIDIDDITYNTLYQNIMKLWTEKSTLKEKINKKMSTIEEDLEVFPKEIKKVIKEMGYENITNY